VRNSEQHRAFLAWKISRPVDAIRQWCDEKSNDGFDDEGAWNPSLVDSAYCFCWRFTERFIALIYLWFARNGEDWTIARALKATVCILLYLDHKFISWDLGYLKNYGSEVAWWSNEVGRFTLYPSSWSFIQVGEGWRNWWVKFDSDCDDSRYS
jgi:hypothetical protein